MSIRVEDETVEVELVGCRWLGPRAVVPAAAVAEGRLKIPRGNGHDHFDLHRAARPDKAAVFAWTHHTRIAE